MDFSTLMVIAGYIVMGICSIWLIVVAFRESALHGLLCWFVPFYAIYYAITRWEDCKRPALGILSGVAVGVAGAVFGGSGGAGG